MPEQVNDSDSIHDFKSAFRREFDAVLDGFELDAQYGVPDAERMTRYINGVQQAVRRVTGQGDWRGADEALERSEEFVKQSSQQFHGTMSVDQYDWAFAVPVRTSLQEKTDNSSEVTPFLPILDSKFGVSAEVRQRIITNLPPSVLAAYEGDERGKGAVVFTPLFEDMRTDLASNSIGENVKLRRDIMQQTSDFVHRRLGARIMGLGALLPSLTHFGDDIKQEGLTTTTGHGGTVYLLSETVRQVLEQGSKNANIGVIGAAGSIGRASSDYMLSRIPEASLNMYDINEAGLQRQVASYDREQHRLNIRSSVIDTLRSSDVVVVAVTQIIDLDILDPDKQLDLTGKVIIDDSQPGSFDRMQVEARGGQLRWVVGHDGSSGKPLHRVGGYNYGDGVGLLNSGDVWGCEAEVAGLALLRQDELAIHQAVSVDRAQRIGAILRSIDIDVADPQSHGRRAA